MATLQVKHSKLAVGQELAGFANSNAKTMVLKLKDAVGNDRLGGFKKEAIEAMVNQWLDAATKAGLDEDLKNAVAEALVQMAATEAFSAKRTAAVKQLKLALKK